MEAGALLQTLRSLELECQRPEVRGDRRVLDRLLHPDFREFGRSGRIYDRTEELKGFSSGPPAFRMGTRLPGIAPFGCGGPPYVPVWPRCE